MEANVWDVAASAPWSFLIGALVGFLVGARFQISRRKDEKEEDE